jgi:hypothetical protein
VEYSHLLISTAFGAMVALTLLILSIVWAFQRKWTGVLFGVVGTLLFIGLSVASIVGIISKAAVDIPKKANEIVRAIEAKEKEREAHRAQKELEIKNLTPTIDWTANDPDWWSSPGTIDWWRTPLRWPYAVVSSDRLRTGTLARSKRSGSPEFDDMQQLGFGFDAYAYNDKLFICSNPSDLPNERYRIYHFETETADVFADEATLWKAAHAAGWTQPDELHSPWQHFKNYWDIEVWQPK